jgi:hypothetical protein
MDAVALAAVTSAVTVLGTKVAEGVATEASKSIWAGLKRIFGWEKEVPTEELPIHTARQLSANPELAKQVLQLLRGDKGTVGQLVGHIQAEKVVVANVINEINFNE